MPLSFQQLRAGFFDTTKVRKAANRANVKLQSQFGAYVRRRIKSSLKYKDNRHRRALIKEIKAIRAEIERARRAGADRLSLFIMRSRLRARRRQLAAAPNPVSTPGQPPFVHRGESGKSPLRELVFFALDPSTNSVVIGPAAFKARGAGTLEHGGPVTIKGLETGKSRTVTIRPRPFVQPAGDIEARNFGSLLRSVVN